jgi:transposase
MAAGKGAGSAKRKAEDPSEQRRGAFSPAQRAAFVDLILRSSSFRNACKLVGVHHRTAYRWLDLGRNGGKGCTAAHKQFAKAYEEAEAAGTQKLLDQMDRHAENDFRAAKVLLDVRDQRFGTRRSVAKANLEKLQAEVETAKANARIAKAKADAAEKAVKGGGQSMIVLGLSAFLETSPLPESDKQRLMSLVTEAGGKMIARRDLGEEPED